MFENPYVFYGLIFAAALLSIDTLLRAVSTIRRANSDVANRLEALRQTKGAENAFGELLKRRGIGGRDGEQTLGGWFNQLIAQTGREYSMPRRIVSVAFLCLVGYILGALFVTQNTTYLVVFALIFGFGSAILLLIMMRRNRIKVFTAQLAPAIDIIVRSLNAGHPLTTSIALVSREMPDPIGSEFGILSDQMTFGSELEQAMLNMYDRVGADELNMVTVSVSVQRGTGGNLAEILENLAQMIRDRLMIRAKIRAISAEGRITAWIMLLFPFGLFYMLLFMVPVYFDPVWESGYGGIVVGVCLALIFFGMIVIRRLVNFDF
ncbi:type II secretion system F family protein [Sulfitobacter aestuariivivens]|uniref:Type II secretion system F family protein n=1 Tax=Sulfitobacter aestuariivivens TaxID=2766981 RepID=A0A927D747_9RHOB|nr:type II secretion system F family protein [Sulfitobacter aestuariivivens]MBD3666215.1 type II secretion system F family protein [Sulfitobacter aestuariivivens]